MGYLQSQFSGGMLAPQTESDPALVKSLIERYEQNKTTDYPKMVSNGSSNDRSVGNLCLLRAHIRSDDST